MLKRSKVPEHLTNFRVPWGPIGEQVFKRSYSHDTEDGGTETWPETVVRVVDGNLGLVSPRFHEDGEREKLIDLVVKFGMIPAGRHLNASGVIGRQHLFNCHASGWDPQEPWAHFTFLFDELMMGGGVGANYSNRYVETMPAVARTVHVHVTCRYDHPDYSKCSDMLTLHDGTEDAETLVVEDSREGWVDAMEKLMKVSFGATKTHVLVVDVSHVREQGASLKTSGGKAAGPKPLVKMLVNAAKILNSAVGRKLTALECMDLDHSMADCVVAGGKRRSSRMSVKSWKDQDIFEFLNCKKVDGTHWTTNISVEVDDEFFAAYESGDRHARTVMRNSVLLMRSNGEPGFWNRSLSQEGERDPEKIYCPNPCGEIALHEWENCNLGHVNLEYFASKRPAEMVEAFRLMARWLVRATFGDITQPRQRIIVNQNRRIGVGFLGFHGWLSLHGIKYSECWKDEGVTTALTLARGAVTVEATAYAKMMGIPAPVKFTTVAPTGSIATLPGTTTGAQALLYKWFKRLVRYSVTDAELAVKKTEGYDVKKDTRAQDTEIVTYWCEDPLVTKVREFGFDADAVIENQEDISFSDSLKVQQMIQRVYADNGVSYTINLKTSTMPNEEDMEATLFKALPTIKGTTIFPEFSREDAPFQKVSKEQWDAYAGRKEVSMVEVECKSGCPSK